MYLLTAFNIVIPDQYLILILLCSEYTCFLKADLGEAALSWDGEDGRTEAGEPWINSQYSHQKGGFSLFTLTEITLV